MSTEILTFSPEFGLEESQRWNTLIFQSDSGKEKRRAKWSKPIRSLHSWLKYENESAVDTIWDFFKARKGRYDTFWIKFKSKKNSKSENEAVGTGDGSQTVFNLDYFPIDTASVKVYFNGVEQTTGWTASNDLTNEVAKITFTTAPGIGVVITATYEYYIQVRFKDDNLSREMIQYLLYDMTLDFEEVLWDKYNPP